MFAFACVPLLNPRLLEQPAHVANLPCARAVSPDAPTNPVLYWMGHVDDSEMPRFELGAPGADSVPSALASAGLGAAASCLLPVKCVLLPANFLFLCCHLVAAIALCRALQLFRMHLQRAPRAPTVWIHLATGVPK